MWREILLIPMAVRAMKQFTWTSLLAFLLCVFVLAVGGLPVAVEPWGRSHRIPAKDPMRRAFSRLYLHAAKCGGVTGDARCIRLAAGYG